VQRLLIGSGRLVTLIGSGTVVCGIGESGEEEVTGRCNYVSEMDGGCAYVRVVCKLLGIRPTRNTRITIKEEMINRGCDLIAIRNWQRTDHACVTEYVW
jgi:hypothetical protein